MQSVRALTHRTMRHSDRRRARARLESPESPSTRASRPGRPPATVEWVRSRVCLRASTPRDTMETRREFCISYPAQTNRGRVVYAVLSVRSVSGLFLPFLGSPSGLSPLCQRCGFAMFARNVTGVRARATQVSPSQSWFARRISLLSSYPTPGFCSTGC